MLERLRIHCSSYVLIRFVLVSSHLPSLSISFFIFLSSFFLAGALNRFASKLKHFKIYTHNCQKMFKFVYQRITPELPLPLLLRLVAQLHSLHAPSPAPLPPAPPAAPMPPHLHLHLQSQSTSGIQFELCTQKGHTICSYNYIYISICVALYMYNCMQIYACVHLDIIFGALSRGCCV